MNVELLKDRTVGRTATYVSVWLSPGINYREWPACRSGYGHVQLHTNVIYNGRTKKQSQTLCQLRTGICRLKSYLAKIQAVDSDQGRCNRGRETLDHFLFRCPRWSNLRHELKRLAANRWGDLAYILGGWSNERKDGPLDKWVPSKAAISAIINFAIATGPLEVRSNEYDEETEDENNRGEEEEDT